MAAAHLLVRKSKALSVSGLAIQGRTAARFLVDSVSRVGCLHRYETIKTGKVLAGSRVLRLLVV
ncbi:MAG: hypothetical protein CMM01_18485 [Rhodopirellula sp.]|nr:hypothetical protein [Rhodopirellula sp.]